MLPVCYCEPRLIRVARVVLCMLDLILILAVACLSHFAAERQVTRLTHDALLQSADFARLPDPTRRRVSRALLRASRQTGIELAALVALVEGESRFQPAAYTRHAFGIAQQIPRYSGKYTDRCWCDVTQQAECTRDQAAVAALTSVDLMRDVEHAARIAARHLLYLRHRYGYQAPARYYGGTLWQSDAAQRYAAAYRARERRWIRRLAQLPL